MQNAAPRGFRTFVIIWLGQSISLIGSGLTGFALGVWVYQRTGSATQFTLIALATALPGIVFSPIAGALVDRWDRKWAMILSDTAAGFCTICLALLFWSSKLEVWHIYIIMAVSSAFSALQWPAYSAATTLLVSKANLGRASGMVQISEAVSQIASPAIAGALMGLIPVQGIFLIDFATLLFAIITLLIVRIPKPPTTADGKLGQGSLLREAAFGWTYIRARPGLVGLLLFFTATNFAMSIANVLFTPMVLSFTTSTVLGVILSVAGVGMLAGSLTMSAWGGPKRRVYGILGSSLLMGIGAAAAGLQPNAWLIGVSAFLVFFTFPISNSCSQAIWQTKTAPDVQGRVFSVRRMIAWASVPVSYLLAGPLADHVFNPLLVEGGQLAGSVGQIIGVGEGRGIGLLYIILGFLILLTVVIAYRYPRLRQVEIELPDFIDSKA